MVRVDIETILMAAAPVPSVIVLREREGSAGAGAPQRALSIQTGSIEAACISKGIEGEKMQRPITHDLFAETLKELGCKLERVEINRVEAPVFFSDTVFVDAMGAEHHIDARPSDAIALAVRTNAPIYVEDDVMNRAGSVASNDTVGDDEAEKFDEFVKTLSPNDF